MTVCQYYQNSFCKYRQQCVNKHVSDVCLTHPLCQKKQCEKCHPKSCRRFDMFKNCKFKRCAYSHDKDNRNNSNIEDIKHEVVELKQSVKKLYESCHNEAKIKTLEEEVKVSKLEIKRLFAFNKRFSKKSEEVPVIKIHEEIIDSANIPEQIKFKCDLCSSSFKKKITLQKHKNTKHDPNYCSPKKKLGEGRLGYALMSDQAKKLRQNHLDLNGVTKIKMTTP